MAIPNKQKEVEFYKQQWSELHDFNELDWRAITVFGPLMTLTKILIILIPFFIPAVKGTDELRRFILSSSLIEISFSYYGISTVSKNQSVALIRLWIISRVERRWGIKDRFLPLGMDCEEIKCYQVFLKELFVRSRRGCLFIVYSFLMFTSLVELLDVFWSGSESWIFSVAFCFTLSMVVIYIYYRDYRKTMTEKKRQ